MTNQNYKQSWISYCSSEVAFIKPFLEKCNIILDEHQPHIAGERYLMQAVTTTHGKKIILLGKTLSGERVVIKATRDRHGMNEIKHERACRQILEKINFARDTFHSPRELHFISKNTFCISITEYIEQTKTFIERPLEEQYNFALTAFQAQEGAHASTWSHLSQIKKVFEVRNSATYLHNFLKFKAYVSFSIPNEIALCETFENSYTLLKDNIGTIEQYTGFLTHTDFVPHNIRIRNNTLYLLDYSSLVFGNKYEGWARFINFMTLYNPPLAIALTKYVQLNRTPEESVALRMMQIYRLGEIINYYVNATEKSDGDLFVLNTARIHFWLSVLTHVYQGTQIPNEIIDRYVATRDKLRSDDEKKRQQELH